MCGLCSSRWQESSFAVDLYCLHFAQFHAKARYVTQFHTLSPLPLTILPPVPHFTSALTITSPGPRQVVYRFPVVTFTSDDNLHCFTALFRLCYSMGSSVRVPFVNSRHRPSRLLSFSSRLLLVSSRLLPSLFVPSSRTAAVGATRPPVNPGQNVTRHFQSESHAECARVGAGGPERFSPSTVRTSSDQTSPGRRAGRRGAPLVCDSSARRDAPVTLQ